MNFDEIKLKALLEEKLKAIENILEQFPFIKQTESEKLWFIRNNLLLGEKNKLIEEIKKLEKGEFWNA